MKPCPICGGENLRVEEGLGIECRYCGLWFGAGGRALDLWRQMRQIRCKPHLPVEPGWLEEVWNTRVKEAK